MITLSNYKYKISNCAEVDTSTYADLINPEDLC